jgi:hypothetical protein
VTARWITALAQSPGELVEAIARLISDTERLMHRLWNGVKALPGVHQAGHAIAAGQDLRAAAEQANTRDSR